MLDDIVQGLILLVVVVCPLAFIVLGVATTIKDLRHKPEKVKPFDGYYQGLLKSLLAEFEKELP